MQVRVPSCMPPPTLVPLVLVGTRIRQAGRGPEGWARPPPPPPRGVPCFVLEARKGCISCMAGWRFQRASRLRSRLYVLSIHTDQCGTKQILDQGHAFRNCDEIFSRQSRRAGSHHGRSAERAQGAPRDRRKRAVSNGAAPRRDGAAESRQTPSAPRSSARRIRSPDHAPLLRHVTATELDGLRDHQQRSSLLLRGRDIGRTCCCCCCRQNRSCVGPWERPRLPGGPRARDLAAAPHHRGSVP